MDTRRPHGAVKPLDGRNTVRNQSLFAGISVCAAIAAAVAASPLASAAATNDTGATPHDRATARHGEPFSGRVVRRHVVTGGLVKVRAHSLDPSGRLSGSRTPVRVTIRVRRDGADHWKTVERLSELGRHASTLRWRVRRPGRYRAQALVAVDGRRVTDSLGRFNVYRRSFASWYGPGFYGGRTACGQTLTGSIMGVAHKTLPCGAKVTFRLGHRTATARVIDRGPYVSGRDWDLTPALKRAIGFGSTGAVLTTR